MDINPLKVIFKLNSNGECTSQLKSIQDISYFFQYLAKNLNGDKCHLPPKTKFKLF